MLYHKSWEPLFSQYDFDIDELYTGPDIVYPKREHLFRVFEMDVKDIKILLLGQDPYHGPGQAHGLSFSVPNGVDIPSSLRNMYKELKDEFPERGYKFSSGNLEKWFQREKIFLLNASLSVIQAKAGSQMEIWEEFTNDVIKYVSENNDKCVFVLLGGFAKAREAFIKDKKRVVKGVHPSGLSAHKGFFGSGIFKKIEELLEHQVDWSN